VDIDDNAITAPKIKAGEVKTSHIRFDTLTSDPTPYEAGEMWYRADLDELRFASGTSYDKVMQIPKIPLGAPMRSLFWFRSTWLPERSEDVNVPSPGYDLWASSSASLHTGTTAGNVVTLQKFVNTALASWNKRRILSFIVELSSVSYTRLRIYSGTWLTTGYPCFGIYFSNNTSSTSTTLYGISYNGSSSTTVSLGTVSEGNLYVFTIEYVPNTFIKFYVNGVLAGTITSNLPSGSADAWKLATIDIYNYTSADKYFCVYQAACMQEI
jgi:hypothetical protein